MAEEKDCADFLRGLSGPTLGPIVSDQLEKAAAFLDHHDERVTDLLLYNNTVLEETRAQRREIERLNARNAALLRIIYGEEAKVEPLTRDEHKALIDAVKENHEHHVSYGADYGYEGSELEKTNLAALELA